MEQDLTRINMEQRKDKFGLMSTIPPDPSCVKEVAKYVHKNVRPDLGNKDYSPRALQRNWKVKYDNNGYVRSMVHPYKDGHPGSHYPKKGWEINDDSYQKLIELRPCPVKICVDHENENVNQWSVSDDNKGYVLSLIAGSGISKKWKDGPIDPEAVNERFGSLRNPYDYQMMPPTAKEPEGYAKRKEKLLPMAGETSRRQFTVRHLNEYGVEMCESDYDEDRTILTVPVAKKRIVPFHAMDMSRASGKGH